MRRVLFIFSQLSDDDVRWLANAGTVENHPGDHLLISEGKRPTKIYFLLEGEIKIFQARFDDQELSTLKSGDVIGEMSFIDAAPASASAKTMGSCEILSLSQQLVEEKLATDTAFAARFYRAIAMYLSDRLRSTYPVQNSSDDNFLDEDELDENLLDSVADAGQRFTDMLRLLKGGI